ncbi:MAG: hypothetical protein B7Y99_02240 [Caulobacterales bacterium 32-69-10]|nr:MAG: hypothetical protein B7Y99_02240 [Caulobacterales bacterium 32-69-10]
MAAVHLHPADDAECDAGRAIAADLISPHVATAATFRRVQAYTRCAVSVFVRDGEVAGVLGMVPITPAGLDAIQRHVFTQKDPPPEHLCAPGDPLACIYGWGFAARTRRASAQVVLGAMSIRDAFPGIAVFTRAATPAGQRIICGKMGYMPYPDAPDDLLWNPVRSPKERAA